MPCARHKHNNQLHKGEEESRGNKVLIKIMTMLIILISGKGNGYKMTHNGLCINVGGYKCIYPTRNTMWYNH